MESVLIGTVNFLAEHKNLDGSMTGEYNVDIRAVSVESGQILTTAGGTKSSGSTYRAMMEKIARRLAENLIVDESEANGIITKGRDFYYLDGQRITDKKYLELIENCPEAWVSYERGCRQRRTGRVLLIAIGGMIVTGAAISLITMRHDYAEAGIVAGGFVGGASALASIPFFASGKHKKENAYQVYNEYCAKPTKPTATLSFGPATQGIGMGVYLNF